LRHDRADRRDGAVPVFARRRSDHRHHDQRRWGVDSAVGASDLRLPRTGSFEGSGTTSPAEMISLAAASTVMSRRMISDSGVKNKKPEVGFGVVGMKTETNFSSPFRCSAISPRASVEMKA